MSPMLCQIASSVGTLSLILAGGGYMAAWGWAVSITSRKSASLALLVVFFGLFCAPFLIALMAVSREGRRPLQLAIASIVLWISVIPLLPLIAAPTGEETLKKLRETTVETRR